MTGAPKWEEKVCSLCKEKKPLAMFGKDGNKPDGRRGECRTCRNQKVKLSHAQSETRGIVYPAVELLNKLPGVLALRLNSGTVQTQAGSWMHLCPRGTADIFACADGQCFFFEAKHEGEKMTFEQKQFADRAQRAGARSFVITAARQAADTIVSWRRKEI